MNTQQQKKSVFESLKLFAYANPLKIVIGLFVIAILIWLACCYRTDGMKWNSPDYKLLNKSHTGQTVRSDSGVDGWSKKDMIESISRFNRAAAE